MVCFQIYTVTVLGEKSQFFIPKKLSNSRIVNVLKIHINYIHQLFEIHDPNFHMLVMVKSSVCMCVGGRGGEVQRWLNLTLILLYIFAITIQCEY